MIARQGVIMNIEWNAGDYHKNFSFVYKYGEELLNLFTLQKGARVADVGCGSAVLTKELRGAGYDVCGIDSSTQMIELAKNNVPDIPFICADATQFRLEEPVDGIFSNAVFHWIDDHEDIHLFKGTVLGRARRGEGTNNCRGRARPSSYAV